MLPLAGRRILVLRSADQVSLGDSLRGLGAEPVEVSVIGLREPEDIFPLMACIKQVSSYDWLIFASANAVKMFLNLMLSCHVSVLEIKGKIAAVGPATARLIVKEGFKVDYIPDEYVAESLVAGFPEDVKGKRILLPRSALARDVIPDFLRAAGATVDAVDAYRNVLPENAPELLKQAVAEPLHAATFTSSSTVEHLAEAAQKAGIPFPLAGVPAVSIGPVTSETLREHGWPPAAEADPHDIPGLVAAVLRIL